MVGCLPVGPQGRTARSAVRVQTARHPRDREATTGASRSGRSAPSIEATGTAWIEATAAWIEETAAWIEATAAWIEETGRAVEATGRARRRRSRLAKRAEKCTLCGSERHDCALWPIRAGRLHKHRVARSGVVRSYRSAPVDCTTSLRVGATVRYAGSRAPRSVREWRDHAMARPPMGCSTEETRRGQRTAAPASSSRPATAGARNRRVAADPVEALAAVGRPADSAATSDHADIVVETRHLPARK